MNRDAVMRLRALPEFRHSTPEQLTATAPSIQRRHCLNVVAAELGFASWTQAKIVISGEAISADFGVLLCPERCCGHLNRWYKAYEEAAAMRQSIGGYLLGYRRQFVVVDRYYIESLGLDPGDRDWEAIGFDWVRPRSRAARARLCAKLVAALPREAA